MNHAGHAKDALTVGLTARPSMSEEVPAPHFRYDFVCYDADGNVKWTDGFENLVTTAGKNNLLDTYFAGSAFTAAWKLGLKGTGAPAAGDTLASHATWAEVTPFAGNRPAITWTAAAGGSKAANTISYTINAAATVAGGFVTDQATGAVGLLYSAGDFTGGSRAVQAGDTLQVSLSVSV